MAIMRTNRLTSKTTPPKTRKMIPASELESQDSSYKKYKEQDLPAYNEKMKKYETERKRVYGFGGENISRSLNPAELSEYNSRQRQEGGLEYKKVKVDPSYNKKSTDADWMVGTAHRTYDPIKPSAPKKSEPADWSNVELNKMPTKKATKIETSGTLKGPKERKTATQGWFGDYVPSTKGASNKQLKQFASYASKTNLGESFIASPKSSIDQYKGEMKSQRKQYIKEGNKAGIKATTADIRQARSAAKFTGSNNPLDVPGMATGYRAAQDNAANRNTIKAQVSSLKKLR
jgi:hypothetical protein